MQNLLVYINPRKGFDNEHDVLARIQIDNSLSLGWKKEDILIFTNFPFEYNGVKALYADESNFCPFRPLSTKTITVGYLLKNQMIDPGQVYWVHDFDAFQAHKITDAEIDLGTHDLGLTTYGWSKKWCLGSFFFRAGAIDIFEQIKEKIYEIHNEDERALVALTTENSHNINTKYKLLNITYNIGMRHLDHNYRIADKPLRVLHFHPRGRAGIDTLGAFMYGKNDLHIPLMPTRLIEIFQHHGIKHYKQSL